MRLPMELRTDLQGIPISQQNTYSGAGDCAKHTRRSFGQRHGNEVLSRPIDPTHVDITRKSQTYGNAEKCASRTGKA
jgi:hypothetical protein